jgi:hypothetical protein
MDAPQLDQCRPIADWPVFTVLRNVAFSGVALALIVGGVGEYIGDDVTKGTTNVVFVVCVLTAVALGCVCIFHARAYPKCGKDDDSQKFR